MSELAEMLNSADQDGEATVAAAAVASFLTAGQAARILGVSPKTVDRWANQKRIPCSVTLGGHRRFRVADVSAVAVSMGVALEEPRRRD